MVVQRLLSYWEGNLSGAILNFWRVFVIVFHSFPMSWLESGTHSWMFVFGMDVNSRTTCEAWNRRWSYPTSLSAKTTKNNSCDGYPNQIQSGDHNSNLSVSKNMGTPKWMVKIMENPIKMDDLGGVFPLVITTGNHQVKPEKVTLVIDSHSSPLTNLFILSISTLFYLQAGFR